MSTLVPSGSVDEILRLVTVIASTPAAEDLPGEVRALMLGTTCPRNRAELRRYLLLLDPKLPEFLAAIAPAADFEDALRLIGIIPQLYDGQGQAAPKSEGLDRTYFAVWRQLDEGGSKAYARAVLDGAKVMRKRPARDAARAKEPEPVGGPAEWGKWRVDSCLGWGGQGPAFKATHVESGKTATLKTHAAIEALVYIWLGDDLPAFFVRMLDWGVGQTPYDEPLVWVAREHGTETWRDFLSRRWGGTVPIAEAIGIFAAVCKAVSALHAAGVYQWSAHSGNLIRTTRGWQGMDLGRCMIAATPDDPRLVRLTPSMACPVRRATYLGETEGGPWRSGGMGGFFPRERQMEHRLREDDCSMLGGLLCDLLGLNRWKVFYQALRSKPLCSGRYRLTGDRRRDERLSAILNRAWRGDAGGAVLVANGGRGEQTTYDDPLEMLGDVRRALRG